jgi:chemotaxis protein MotB
VAKVKVIKDNAERWILTYADVMNLLLILFILLYSMANVDVAKYQQVAQSLRAAFGDSAASQVVGEGGAAPSIVNLDATAPSPVIPATLEQQQMEQVKNKVADIIKKEGLSGQVEVTMQERGIVISIEEKVLFPSGSADLEPESKVTIEQLGKVLLAIPGKHIRVEGHTDNVPIKNSRFPDNQELSTARANSVWRILVNDVGLDPQLLSTTGYGEYRPKVPNDTVENKKQNRRVDIAILNDLFDKSESGVSKTVDTNAPVSDITTGSTTDYNSIQ